MRLILISIISVLFLSCSFEDTLKNEELAVVAAIYSKIPKILPPPPATPSNTQNNEESNFDDLNLDPLIFNYAINRNFIYYNFNYKNDISNEFKIHKSKELFEVKILDSSYMKIITNLQELKKAEKIDEFKLSKLLNDDLVYWNKRTISIKEKKENNISGIISFSRVSFNNEYTKAAVVVGDYFERIGSGVSLYILQKKDNKWIIKYQKTLETS